MAIHVPLRNKVTLIPGSTIQRDPHEIIKYQQWFPFYFVIMMPNIVSTINKAIRRNDYSLAFVCASVTVGFFLLQFCLSKYFSLPKNEKSSQKFFLNLNIWFLYTAVSFGVVYQFADFIPWQMTVVLYVVVSVCSSLLFYGFVIADLVKYLRVWRHDGEDETKLPENQSVDTGKLNCYSVSILEKV